MPLPDLSLFCCSCILSIHETVGYFNYRYFVNFLLYVFMGMMYGAIISFQPFMLLSSNEFVKQWQLEKQFQNTPTARLRPMLPRRDEQTLVSMCFMLCVAVGFAVAMLGGFHVYLTCTAQTTIEFHANWATKRRLKAMGQKFKNPYSAGSWKRNWQQVYGPTSQSRFWFVWSLLPSMREPDVLPAPVPGHPGRRQWRLEHQKQLPGDIEATTTPLLASSENGQSNGIEPDSEAEEMV